MRAAPSVRSIASPGAVGYGSLRPTKARNTGEEMLTLPEGFEYNVIGRTGAKMSDGNPTPAAHDGMAAFNVKGELRLARNHEINGGIGRDGAAFGDAALAYDPKAGGGVTTSDHRSEDARDRQGFRQSQRHAPQLRGRPYAVGFLDQLRRDDARQEPGQRRERP